jgi:hypothetical protein
MPEKIKNKKDEIYDLIVRFNKLSINDYPIKEIEWMNQLGNSLIHSVEISINGITYDKQYGDWLSL